MQDAEDIELLLKSGVDVNFKDKGGQSHLHRAVNRLGTPEVFELLVKYGINVNAYYGQKMTALRWMIEDHAKIFK